MALTSAVFKSGATWAPTGGSDVTLVSDGRQISNGVSLVVSGDTDLITRRSLQFVATLPALAVNSAAFAKLGRNSVRYAIPFIADDGKLYTQIVRIETSFHSEYTAKATAVADIAALVSDSDFTDFWTKSLLT